MSSVINVPGLDPSNPLTLTIPDIPSFAAVAALPNTEGTDTNDEGETVIGTTGPSSPFQLASEATTLNQPSDFAPPLVVSAPPAPAQQSAFPGAMGYAVLALIVGVIAFAVYMLWKDRGKIEAELK